MNTKTLLAQLIEKVSLMNLAIELIEQELAIKTERTKAKAILKSIKTKAEKPHWTQLPKNKAKLRKIGKAMAERNRLRQSK